MFKTIKNYLKKDLSVQWFFRKDGDYSFNWAKNKGLNFYEISLYLNRAINKRAEKVAETEFILKDLKGNEVQNEWSELLRNPNNYHTGDQFLKLWQKYKDIYGEVYVYKEPSSEVFRKNAVPNALYLLRPDLVEKLFNADETEIIGYRYSPTSGKSITYVSDEIIYDYNPDPRRPLYGESLVRSGLRSLEIETQASEYQAKSIKYGGNIDTIIKFKDALNKEQIGELREGWRNLKNELWENGTPNEPMFAGGDMDILRLNLSPQELNYIESKKLAINDIVALTGVPLALMGITSGETFSNADVSIRIFLREQIKPLISQIVDVLNWRLIPDQFELSYIDPTPEDREQKRLDIATASQVYALTTNEKREMLGLEPIKGGDELLIPFNLTTLTAKPIENQVKKKTNPLKDEKTRRAYGEAYVKNLENSHLIIKRWLKDYFTDQEKRLTGYIGKAIKSKSLIDDGFNLDLEIRLAKSGILPIIKDLFIKSGQEQMLFLEGGDFNYTSIMETTLSLRAELFARSINETTFNKLKNEFIAYTENQETKADLIKRIRDYYDDTKKGRAEMIARTETHTALQSGIDEASKQYGLEMKIWVWGPGIQGGIRDEHLSMDGEEVPINSAFSNGLEYPGDPSGDAGETINCQCTRV